ncbi:MAG: YncE family protein, partial [Euryarchaeota archaeon]|nr:YncE family protein [Euryarchaeota archaeon]
NSITVVNISTNQVVGSVLVGGGPGGEALDTNTGILYVTNTASMNISLVSTQTDKVVAWRAAGRDPAAVAYDRVNGDVYVANFMSDNLTVIDGRTQLTIGSIPTGSTPGGIAVDPSSDLVYVTNFGSNNVSIINGSTNTVLASVPVGVYPLGAIVDPFNGEVYVANSYSNNISVISGRLGQVIATIGPVPTPEFFAYDAMSGYLYSADGPSNEVSWIAPQPALLGLQVTPGTASTTVGRSVSFSATPACFPVVCGPGIVYHWAVSNPLGTMASPGGAVGVFVAGASAGNLTLYVNATLAGYNASGQPVAITILPELSSVGIAPPSVELFPRTLVTLTANAVCAGGSCARMVNYSWMSDGQDGTLLGSSGSIVQYRAGNVSGTEAISVTATIAGESPRSGHANVTVVVNQSRVSSPHFAFGLSPSEWTMIFSLLAASLLLAIVLVLLLRRKRRGTTANLSPDSKKAGNSDRQERRGGLAAELAGRSAAPERKE